MRLQKLKGIIATALATTLVFGTMTTAFAATEDGTLWGVSMKETVANANGLKIDCVGIEECSIVEHLKDSVTDGYRIKLNLSNSTSMYYEVEEEAVFINGKYVRAYFDRSMVPQAERTDEILIRKSDLESVGVNPDEIKTVALSFYVDYADNSSDAFVTSEYTMNLSNYKDASRVGSKTSEENMSWLDTIDTQDSVDIEGGWSASIKGIIGNANGMKFTATTIDECQIINYITGRTTEGYRINVDMVNSTSMSYVTSVDTLRINSKYVEDIFSYDMVAHAERTGEILIEKSDLESIGITDIKTIDIGFYVYNRDNYSDSFVTTECKINVPN